MSSTSSALRDVFTVGRPLVEQWAEKTRALNVLFMGAWCAGNFDDAWAEYRKTSPDLWLTYYIRARGMGDIKIGKSNHLGVRFKSLLTGASRGLDLISCYPSTLHHEGELKDEFAHLRLCGEWFRPGRELLTHLELIGCDINAFTNEVPPFFGRSPRPNVRDSAVSDPQSSAPSSSQAETTAADAVLPVSAATQFEREVVAA